jgi:pyruvate dehydrogenase E2 component (dihydrolipoamide acetyltransferase)
MPTKVVMEALSPTMEEGRLVKWLKNEGDAVSSGDVLAEVETDKAVMELVARGDGVLRKQLIGEGSSAPVGSTIAVIAAEDEDIESLVAEAPAAGAEAKPAEKPESKTPAAAGIDEPPARRAGDGNGDGGDEAETEAEGEADAGKPPPREDGGARRKPRQEGGRPWPSSIPRAPGQEQGEASMPPQERDRRGDGRAMPQPKPPRPPSHEEEARVSERVRSSPLARRLASERGVELDGVQGSGPGGRIVKRDVEAAAEAPRAAGRAAPEGDYEDIPLTQMRKTIARRLAESIGPVPTFYLTAEYDLERVAEMRTAMTELGDEFKVSFNDIVLKAVATALAQHPEVNAHWLGDRMRYFNRVHLGLAVAVEDGLITPVVFDADRKRLSEISAEARELAGRARERRLKPEEYTGATFTVSNLGMFGIEHFTAIINPPEAGILAVGAIEEKPVVIDGTVQTRRRMRVTMSCDHRVIDGATGAKFLQTLRRFIENPLMLVY